MRSLWKGAVSFGLVNIPVRMYAATENKNLSFNLLHRKCHTPIRYAKVCPTCDQEVSQDEITRGYEYESRRFVILEPEDLADLLVPTLKAVEILDFVDLQEVDPIYYEKSYYLEPSEGATKPYSLLLRAMTESRKAALGKITIRTREALCCLRPYRSILALATMHYPDEVRPVDQLLPAVTLPQVSPSELNVALQLIQSLATAFDPSKYEDAYRKALLEVIESKAAGRQIHEAPTPEPLASDVMDLMAALEASLQAVEKEKQSRDTTETVSARER